MWFYKAHVEANEVIDFRTLFENTLIERRNRLILKQKSYFTRILTVRIVVIIKTWPGELRTCFISLKDVARPLL